MGRLSGRRARCPPGPPARRSASATTESGTPKPERPPSETLAAKIVATHAAGAVHHRPARVARAHASPQRGDLPPHRARARTRPGSARSRSGRAAPGARRRDRSRGSRGSPPPCPRGASARSRSAGSPARSGTRSRARSLRRVEPDRLGVLPGALAAQLDGGVVLPGHHVGVRDHQAVAGEPAAPLHAEPAGGAQHLHHAARRRARTSGSRAIRESGRPTPGSGPWICGNGSKRASAFSMPARRRQVLVQLGRGSPSAGSARAARARPAC